LVAGAEAGPLAQALKDPLIRQRTPRWAYGATRYGSICAGTFVLAWLQLIDGRRVASHWSACGPLAAAFPKVQVDADAIFIEDGNVWTSAGVSTGIDMALAMVTNDIGAAIASDVAKRLVLYVRRPGNQSQFSPLLRAQRRAENPFGDLMNWVHLHLDQKLTCPLSLQKHGSANGPSSGSSRRRWATPPTRLDKPGICRRRSSVSVSRAGRSTSQVGGMERERQIKPGCCA
jgi:hypothetical protein